MKRGVMRVGQAERTYRDASAICVVGRSGCEVLDLANGWTGLYVHLRNRGQQRKWMVRTKISITYGKDLSQ